MLDELNEDIVFLCHAIKEDKCTDLHQRYLEAFLRARQPAPLPREETHDWSDPLELDTDDGLI